jgi:iron complex transport system substrate-binding protein
MSSRLTVFLILSMIMILSVISGAEAATLKYRDKMGRTVTLQTPVKRAVLYETYELLPVTGAWERVAGISRFALENDLLLAVRPDLCRTIPSAGSAMELNAEALFRLKPDVIVTWSINPKAVNFLASRGLNVIAVYPESIPELYEVMRLQGKLFGGERRVESAISEMEKIFSLIRARTSTIPASARKSVLWLSGKPTTVAGRIGVNNNLFDIINLKNSAGAINERTADVALERIAAWNPDLVFIWGSARYGAGDLMGNPQWRHIRAVKDRAVYKAPKWSTWSPRLAPVALWMAARAYPERFMDVDIDKIINNFYLKVYNIPYEKVRKIAN